MKQWEFWIDVGGTFTDCIARDPDGRLITHKLLSTGITKGTVEERLGTERIVDPARIGEAANIHVGCDIRFYDDAGGLIARSQVTRCDPRTGIVSLAALLSDDVVAGTRYELVPSEEAPIVAIRTSWACGLAEPIPPVTVRLGTTRGTNALLTRRGARTAFVTTRGFADVLLIANQDRPRLFDLAIQQARAAVRTRRRNRRADRRRGQRASRRPMPHKCAAQMRELQAGGHRVDRHLPAAFVRQPGARTDSSKPTARDGGLHRNQHVEPARRR